MAKFKVEILSSVRVKKDDYYVDGAGTLGSVVVDADSKEEAERIALKRERELHPMYSNYKVNRSYKVDDDCGDDSDESYSGESSSSLSSLIGLLMLGGGALALFTSIWLAPFALALGGLITGYKYSSKFTQSVNFHIRMWLVLGSAFGGLYGGFVLGDKVWDIMKENGLMEKTSTSSIEYISTKHSA